MRRCVVLKKNKDINNSLLDKNAWKYQCTTKTAYGLESSLDMLKIGHLK